MTTVKDHRIKPFLEHVAEDIVSKYGTDLSEICVVFPGKRASLFMNQHLLRVAGKPIWSPHYMTISDLFRENSGLGVADIIQSICVLYDVYQSFIPSDETLDHFWGWGEVMLSDFDDLDKNMAHADTVYNNVRDLHAFDNVDFLDFEKREVLKRFFAEFSDDQSSKIRQRFEVLWNQLSDIYHKFNEVMKASGVTYEGALYREVAENAINISWPYKKYIFVGFNMIQKVEQKIFSVLRDEGRAAFYWDFDRYYLDDSRQEAGRFIEKWLTLYPNELNIKDNDIYSNFRHEKHITYLSASTENIQARYIADWLASEGRMDEGARTAIVLADEKLLKSAIHYLPRAISGKANITIGYPLSESPVSAFVENFMVLHIHGYNPQQRLYMLTFADRLLNHPYIRFVTPGAELLSSELHDAHKLFPKVDELCNDTGLKLIFEGINASRDEMNGILLKRLLNILKTMGEGSEKERVEEKRDGNYEQQFIQESVYRMYRIIQRVSDLVASGILRVDPITMLRLIKQIISSITMPFHGEPAVGIQIMGVLETRNLDFDHLLILSCGEGNMPKGVDDSSLIPHAIRKAHQLTTIENKVAIYAYYFYRLLQRAQDITIAYNASTEDGISGAMSRFMQQLMVECDQSVIQIDHKSLSSRQEPRPTHVRVIEKDESVMAVLSKMTKLSPSAINAYLRCPLLFYFSRVSGIKENEADDISDSRAFGTVFHAAAENMYNAVMDSKGVVSREAIEALINERNHISVTRYIDEAFSREIFHGGDVHYDGLQLITREVIRKLIIQLLSADREVAPITILGLEHELYQEVTFNIDGVERNFRIGGFIDRLDSVREAEGEVIRVVDYKTGRNMQGVLAGVEEIFARENLSKHSDYYLQAMLYSIIVRHKSNTPVRPALLFIQIPESVANPILRFGTSRSSIPITDVIEYEEKFMECLGNLLSEIFSAKKPFVPTDDADTCKHCAYSRMCRARG